jgi:SM-20-related protein
VALSDELSSVERHGVCARDEALSEEESARLTTTVASIPLYYVNHSQYRDTHELYGHWDYPLVIVGDGAPRDVADELDALDESLEPIKVAWRRAAELLPPGSLFVNCYVNGYTYGTDGYPHYEVSGPRASEQRTVLFYCCERWEPAWGGETVFFDGDGDVAASILPRPRRALVFKGDVLHVARAPSRFCPVERRVLVFKAWTNGLPS